ncbi:hypothetical protein FRC12_014605 [Ceratobasidium sp. 428]|nr:hypothetical protein FRC12_014605 [Ceratobasidium sp. 428]
MTAHQAIGYYVMGFLCHFWVDWFPFLRFLPDWFPGAGFKTFGKEGKALLDRFANEPFDAVLDQLKHGRVENVSYSSRLLEEKGGLKASAEDIDLIRWSCASLFGGGSSTSVGIIATFFILIPLYPEFARRAQEEIDSVTSRDRLPNLEDIPRMPYFNALLQEVMRTYPSVPLGIPHCASEEIPFKGYVIPKGAIIYGNIWGMLHDPEQFPEPFTFNPDRFLSSTPEPDPRQYIYGFGRRVCPGFHVANNGIWIICSTILALFDAQPNEDLLARVADVGGRDSKDLYKVIHGYASGRSPCNLVLRDQVAASLLEHS